MIYLTSCIIAFNTDVRYTHIIFLVESLKLFYYLSLKYYVCCVPIMKKGLLTRYKNIFFFLNLLNIVEFCINNFMFLVSSQKNIRNEIYIVNILVPLIYLAFFKH